MKKWILFASLLFASSSSYANNNFGPLNPTTGPDGLIWADLGSGSGGIGNIGGLWFECYGTTLNNPLNMFVCGAAASPYAAYNRCVDQKFVNIACRRAR